MKVIFWNSMGSLALLGAVLAAASIVTGEDAPPPSAPPTVHLKFVTKDYKPKPRPKPQSATKPLGLKGSSAPVAKDAPKPTKPPTVWLDYINKDYKPKPRPKPAPSAKPSSLKGSSAPAAKDAPPPTAPPTVWLKYINEDIKAPPIRPKSTVDLDPLDPFGRPKKIGAPPPQGGRRPQASAPRSSAFPPKNPPYVHPRDLKDLKGKPRPRY